jgi:nitroreductase
MTADEAIRRRRSRPRFDPSRPVPDPLLARLLSLAGRAPSRHNLQPWRWLVVRDVKNRERLRRCCFGHPALLDAPVAIVVLGARFPIRSHWDLILEQMKRQAALDPEAAGRVDAEARRDQLAEPDPSCWACTNAALASSTLMIAAEGLGLATTPIDRFRADAIRDGLGIPLDHALCGLIALGYPDPSCPDVPSLGRLPLAELCFEEHFGQPWTLGEAE